MKLNFILCDKINLIIGQKYMVVNDYYLFSKKSHCVIYDMNCDTNYMYFNIVLSKEKIQKSMNLDH